MVNNSVANATQHPQDDLAVENQMSGTPADENPKAANSHRDGNLETRMNETPADENPAVDHDPAPNPFDPERYKLGQDYASNLGVRKVLTVVRCRKPTRQEFVRVRPGEAWRLDTALYENKSEREHYLVNPGLWPAMGEEITPVLLLLAVNRQADVFLWPVKLPGADGRSNSWNDSAKAGAELAQKKWVRVSSNMAAGQYDVVEALGDLGDPEWPDKTFPEILELCFKGRVIETADHEMFRKLRGEE